MTSALQRLEYALPVSDELIVDGFFLRAVLYDAMGVEPPVLTPAEIVSRDAAASRLRVKEREREARWMALPLRVRVSRVIRGELHRQVDPLREAIRAFRSTYRESRY